ncbi:hypothetical protein FRC09_009922 [Ceratobasidium sp. 395]|nr:hypothetical protein FRC09_009922 [Ceratobasidium sp. 395]
MSTITTSDGQSIQGFNPPENNPMLAAFLDRIAAECESSVSAFQTRFWCLSPPTHDPTFSPDLPTFFTSFDSSSFNSLYTLWLLTPIPSIAQLATLRQSREAAISAGNLSVRLHQPPGFPGDALVPIWMLECWNRLHTLLTYSKAWTNAKDWLQQMARQGRYRTVAEQCLARVGSLPLHSPVPNSPHLSTSRLPTLLGHAWLSDEEMNAGGHSINTDPSCPLGTRVLDTHFIGSLALHRQRSPIWSPSRPRLLDIMVADGRIKDLYIVIHKDSHWRCMRINIAARQYQYTDSMSPSTLRAPSECVDLLNWWLSAVLSTPIGLTPAPHLFTANQQVDSHSCGIAVLTNMAHMVLGDQFGPWTQESASLFRMRWFLRLTDESLLQVEDSFDAVPLFDCDPDDEVYTEPDATTHIMPPDSPFSLAYPSSPLTFSTSLPDCPSSPTSSLAESDISNYGTHADDSEWDFVTTPGTFTKPSPGPQLVQTRLPFLPVSRAEKETQDRERYAKFQEQCRIEREREALEQTKARLAKTTYERERKRVQRTLRRAMQIETGLRSSDGRLKKKLSHPRQKVLPGPSSSPPPHRLSIATVSRPHRAYKDRGRKLQLGHDDDSAQTQVSNSPARINWSHPLLWGPINNAVVAEGFPWSPIAIVRRLQRQDPVAYADLAPQRISDWRDPNYKEEFRWKESRLQAAAHGYSATVPVSKGSVLSSHPRLSAIIQSHLRNLRAAGVALQLRGIRGFMVGLIQHEAPEMFTQPTQCGKPFKLSDSSVRRFLHEELGWSLRRATRPAQKTPSNVGAVLLRAFLRLACLVRDEDIPPCCIVNADQTQVVYLTGSGSSWSKTGERQVSIIGADEKRAFTLMVGVSLSGKVLPLQAIYAGKTTRSVPDSSSPGFERAHDLGFDFVPSLKGTYWSTLATMQSYVTDHLAPYFLEQIRIHNLPPEQRCAFQIDCWSLHRSALFREWMKQNYPWISLQYVPGGCTGLVQACDVGIQRILKLAIRDACHQDIVDETFELLQSGTPASEIVNDTTLKTLRNRSVRWILEGYDAVNDEELVKKAFRLCAVPGTDFNLSYESLTSRAARAAILELRTSDPTFYAEITSGAIGMVSDEEGQLEDDAANAAVDTEEELPEVTATELRASVLNSSSSSDLIPPCSGDLDCSSGGLDEERMPQSSEPLTPTNAPIRPRRSARLSRR